MKLHRNATAKWQGTGKDGSGSITTQSKALDGTALSYKTRFKDEPGTNPEELIGAAHAGCYTMKLSFLLSGAGYTPTDLETKATVHLEDGITLIELDLTGNVPNITKEEFDKYAQESKETCPISMLLDTKITLNVTLK